jgi:hypothetical protein
MAFFAANAFVQKNANDKDEIKKIYEDNIEGEHPGLYDKLISQCLDIYELLFYWDDLNLDQKGFKIQAFALPEISALTEKNRSKEKEKHFNFRTTIDLYIDRYTTKLNLSKEAIDCGYYICYNGQIIAVTSPLTGFYVSASVDFGFEGINNLWPNDKSIIYLSNDEHTYRPLGNRNEKLRIFLHKIINQYCPKGYTYFREYVKEYAKKLKLEADYNNDETVDLSKYGFGNNSPVDLIKEAIITPDTKSGKTKSNAENVIAVPDRYNKIYFRSLLDIKKGISFNLTADDYKDDLDDRKLLGQKVKWLSVDDFFRNHIVELDDAINTDRFYCCKVRDKHGKESEVKVLLPLKDRFFQFFNYDKNDDNAENQLAERLEIKIVNEERYVATLNVPTKSGNVLLVKEYQYAEETEKSGIVRLADDEDSLYLGIYPFVKDATHKENNAFFRVFTYHSQKIASELEFYKDTDNGLTVIKDNNQERHITSKSYRQDFEMFPISTFYALQRSYLYVDRAYNLSNEKDIDFEVIKITLKKGNNKYESVLIPNFIHKQCNGKSGMVSVDFGTSNTNISIGTNGGAKKVSDYDSYIYNKESEQISQIVMLHKPKDNKFDFEASRFGATNQNHLLSEFMPTIISKDHKHYKFALPSVINLHEDLMEPESVSLVHANIPVAYYSKGLRIMHNKEIDKPFANFKWIGNDKQKELYVYLFIDQLLFMARNLLLANEQDPREATLIYATPLSMKDSEKLFYSQLWNGLSEKYFAKKNLHNISESRAPYYASGKEFGANSTILLDVGGGSTDILFYQNKVVKGTTSYAYAANALFAGTPNENIFIKQMPREASKEKETDMNEVEESATMSVCDIFNYRFTKKEDIVKKHFLNSSEWKYLLTLHCSALLYHTIQVNKALLEDDNIPLRNILFSGNGSKLFKLLNGIESNNNKLERLTNNIVRYIYKCKENERKIPVEISFVDDKWITDNVKFESTVGMKAATSIGGICWQMDLKNDKGQEEDPHIIPIGDETELLKTQDLTNDIKREKYDAGNRTKQEEIIEKVSSNFEHFLNGFLGVENENSLFDCGLRTFILNPIHAEEVRKIIEKRDLIRTSIQDYHLEYPTPEHSIFFVPLQRLIIELSKHFASK